MPDYPRVIGRAPQSDDTEPSVTVRMSAEPNDVIHMDLKRGESLTDGEAVAAAEYMRYVAAVRSEGEDRG